MYDYLVFIGRFQIFHAKHEATVRIGLQKAKKVITVIGSTDCARSLRNPFTATEREEMIRSCFTPEENERIIVARVSDYFYNDEAWTVAVQEQVRRVSENSRKIGILGTRKDHTSYYLDLFPQWGREFTTEYAELNATDLRDLYWDCKLSGADPRLNDSVYEWLMHWQLHNRYEFDGMVKEKEFIKQYKASWAGSPFPVTFVATDAVVIKSGHVLMIKRGHNPGKGLWALPGGYLEHGLTLFENSLKELKEETNIRVHKDELRKYYRGEKTFDHPQRSDLGRFITTAFLFRLPDAGPLPEIKGGDDAAEAMWVEFSDLFANRPRVFSDHFHIINYFYGKR